ncbi:hypothetical protein PQX77_003945 [Marasmius sp. AFHP31]|nr:hypothetical protein PQX77_003945 [Marasmius sp. AFHP31]
MAISAPSDMTHQRRPTLPSLHTLDLPTLSSSKPQLPGLPHAIHDYGRLSRSIHAPHAQRQRPRQFSTSSSRTPSPTLSERTGDQSFASTSATTLTPHLLSQTKRPDLRLIPCSSIEEADAVVFVPPRSLQGPNEQSSALLLVGPSLNELRHPQRKIAKGARIHPYKFARRTDVPSMRRTSSSSSVTTVSSMSSC